MTSSSRRRGSSLELAGRGECAADVGVLDAEVGLDEVFLAGEVAVEGGARDARLADDAVDADGVDAVSVEELGCGAQQAFAGLR